VAASFDRVNHYILMGLVAKRVSDKRILKLIRGFLTAGGLTRGLVSPTEEGTPQGGPLSPLLSNLMLDVLDKELEARGLHFARYADDCNIYVRSQRAGERVMASVERFLTRRLKLKVNKTKSAVARPGKRKFLGFSFTYETASAAHRAPGTGPVPKPGTGTDASYPRQEPRADRQGAVRLSHRMARLLRLLRDPVGVARS
jgi:RNA-directed DNA polymerase